jgi:hypothetical protein
VIPRATLWVRFELVEGAPMQSPVPKMELNTSEPEGDDPGLLAILELLASEPVAGAIAPHPAIRRAAVISAAILCATLSLNVGVHPQLRAQL